MTEHRPGMRIEIARTVDPFGRPAVLFQADDWHVILPPFDALEVAESIAAVARGVIVERN